MQTTVLRKILTPDCPKPAQPLQDLNPSESLKCTVRKQKYISTAAICKISIVVWVRMLAYRPE